jgi:putative transposase
MIDRDRKLSITRQASLLNISRGTVYYLPEPVSPADLMLMRKIDALHLEHPFMGARMLRDQLRMQGIHAGRRHIRMLMLRMGIAALAPQPGQSGLGTGHDLHTDGQRLCVPYRRGGRGLAEGTGAQGGNHARSGSRQGGD